MWRISSGPPGGAVPRHDDPRVGKPHEQAVQRRGPRCRNGVREVACVLRRHLLDHAAREKQFCRRNPDGDVVFAVSAAEIIAPNLRAVQVEPQRVAETDVGNGLALPLRDAAGEAVGIGLHAQRFEIAQPAHAVVVPVVGHERRDAGAERFGRPVGQCLGLRIADGGVEQDGFALAHDQNAVRRHGTVALDLIDGRVEVDAFGKALDGYVVSDVDASGRAGRCRRREQSQ